MLERSDLGFLTFFFMLEIMKAIEALRPKLGRKGPKQSLVEKTWMGGKEMTKVNYTLKDDTSTETT